MRPPTPQPESTDDPPSLRQYVFGDGGECLHPRDHRTYLGNQREGAYYRCDRCGAVIVITRVASLPAGPARSD